MAEYYSSSLSRMNKLGIYSRSPLKRMSIASLFPGSFESLNIMEATVQLLDDRAETVQFATQALGSQLLQVLCRHLDVSEDAKYFGFRYQDNDQIRQWLDLDEKVMKQLKDLKDKTLGLRVYYYPSNPLTDFANARSKHLLYLQLRRDFYMGRLRTSWDQTCQLVAYAIQADHNLTCIPEGFDIINIPGGMRILHQVNQQLVQEVTKMLEDALCLTEDDAKDRFIQLASEMQSYGMEPYQVFDQLGNGLCIGFNYQGIVAFKSRKVANEFKWEEIDDLSYSNKNLIFTISQNTKRLGFKCKSTSEAKMLFRKANDCRSFFKKPQFMFCPTDATIQNCWTNEQRSHSLTVATDFSPSNTSSTTSPATEQQSPGCGRLDDTEACLGSHDLHPSRLQAFLTNRLDSRSQLTCTGSMEANLDRIRKTNYDQPSLAANHKEKKHFLETPVIFLGAQFQNGSETRCICNRSSLNLQPSLPPRKAKPDSTGVHPTRSHLHSFSHDHSDDEHFYRRPALPPRHPH